MTLSLDAFGSLLFLAGFLAAVGLAFTVMAGYQHVQILRYLRNERRSARRS